MLGISFYLGAKAKSASGYFAAHGQIPWFVNGVAFAGDYLSAASFLGICGMIAFYGYDGFLYSIGYLAGWIVALFVIAEPLKRLGKYTFADALDSQFNSRGIKLAAAISTLVVSIFYLIPQMVGAGRAGQAAAWASRTRSGVVDGRRRRDADRRHRRHGLDDVGAVPQGLAAGGLQHGADGDDPGSRASTEPLDRPHSTLEIVAHRDWILPSDPDLPSRAGRATLRPTSRLGIGRSSPSAHDASDRAADPNAVRSTDGDAIVNGLPQGNGEGEADFCPVGAVSRAARRPDADRPARPARVPGTLQESEVVLWAIEKITDDDGT